MIQAGGKHLIVEFKCSDSELLNNGDKLEKLIADASEKSGFSVKMKLHKFTPYGITAVGVLGESHVIMHTFPEFGHVSLDVYTCYGDPNKIFNYIKKHLKIKLIESMELLRGSKIEDTLTIMNERCDGYFDEYKVKRFIVDKKTRHQHIKIIENKTFGKMLFLDNDLQFSEVDESAYNNAITPKISKNASVLILGGDGSVLKHLLKKRIKKATVVELDGEVIKACSDSFEGVKKAFGDKKTRVVISPYMSYLIGADEKFDLIVVDLTPECMKISRKTFLSDFLKIAGKRLSKKGVLSMQCCSIYDKKELEEAKKALKKNFKKIETVNQWVPSYGTIYNFVHAYK